MIIRLALAATALALARRLPPRPPSPPLRRRPPRPATPSPTPAAHLGHDVAGTGRDIGSGAKEAGQDAGHATAEIGRKTKHAAKKGAHKVKSAVKAGLFGGLIEAASRRLGAAMSSSASPSARERAGRARRRTGAPPHWPRRSPGPW